MKKILLFITCIMYIQQSIALNWPYDWTTIKETGYGTIKNITQTAKDQMPELSTTKKVLVAIGIVAIPALYILKSWWSKSAASTTQDLNQQTVEADKIDVKHKEIVDDFFNQVINKIKITKFQYTIKIIHDSNASYTIQAYFKPLPYNKATIAVQKSLTNISDENFDQIKAYISEKIKDICTDNNINRDMLKYEEQK